VAGDIERHGLGHVGYATERRVPVVPTLPAAQGQSGTCSGEPGPAPAIGSSAADRQAAPVATAGADLLWVWLSKLGPSSGCTPATTAAFADSGGWPFIGLLELHPYFEG